MNDSMYAHPRQAKMYVQRKKFLPPATGHKCEKRQHAANRVTTLQQKVLNNMSKLNYSQQGGDEPSLGGIRPNRGDTHGQSFEDGHPRDARVWKFPARQNNTPAPQFENPRPDANDELARLARTSRSKSPLAGHNALYHEQNDTQYAHSLSKGLHTRASGSFMHEYCAPSDAEELHPATKADVARGKYDGLERQGGNRHHAQGDYTDLVQTKSGLTRRGQSPKPRGDNYKDTNTNEYNPNDCGTGGY